jgi:hypothetical protein
LVRLSFVTEQDISSALGLADEVGKMLQALINKLSGFCEARCSTKT